MTAGFDIGFPRLGIYIEHLKNHFSVFGIDIAFYGCILGLGILCGALLAFGLAKKSGQSVDMYMDFCLYAVIFAVIGARLYYVAFQWDYYRENLLEIFNLRAGGLAIYGGVIGAVLTLAVFAKVRKQSFFRMADTAIPGLLLGQVIGRWGNFVNCEVFGRYTEGPLAMQIRKELVRASDITSDIAANLKVIDGVEYVQVTPTFLYEGLWNLGVLLFLLWYRRHRKFEGELFLLYFVGYGIGRAWIEGIRTDQLYLWNTTIPVSQALSLVLALAAGILWAVLRFRKRKEQESEEVDE
ncbi:MAG: prolipoprotein diacylglyceryl transferase [Lachnospiraceae bacterium]|nr:prolipoprotein diacylglyceryl transferase [Lachnospiraceae bacterium]